MTSYTYGPEYRSGEWASRKDRREALALVTQGKCAESFGLSHPYGTATYYRDGTDVILHIASDNGRCYSRRRVAKIASA